MGWLFASVVCICYYLAMLKLPHTNESPYLKDGYIGKAEISTLKADVIVSLFGETVTDLDRAAAEYIRSEFTPRGLTDLTIGRATFNSDMTFLQADAEGFWGLLSRNHASFHFEEGGIRLTDHSKNGTGVLRYEDNVPAKEDGVTVLRRQSLVIPRTEMEQPNDVAARFVVNKAGLILELRFTTY